VLPVDSGTTPPELLSLAKRLGARALLLPADAAHDPARDGACIRLLDEPMRLSRGPETNRRRYPGAAVLKLTSGSTSVPKSAVTSEAELIADSARIAAAMHIGPADLQMATIPVSHAYGLGNLVLPLLLQGTQLVLRQSFVPQQLLSDAAHYRAQTFQGVPFMFHYFLLMPSTVDWPLSLTSLISAGAPLQADIVRGFFERFGLKIHSFYGSSESGGIAFDAGDEIDDSGTVGAPLPGVTVTLRDTEDARGRIHVASDAVSSGYADGENDAFTDGGFLTGDCGRWDDKGRLSLAGRVSSFVNVAGHKVRPDEVEEVLRTMPGVADVRVIGADDSRRGEQIVACIVAEHVGSIAALAVRRFCAARLAPYKIPRAVVFVGTIPTTARGKVDRAAIADLVRGQLSV